MSDLNDHIEEKDEAGLQPGETGEGSSPADPVADGENHHHLYLHAADPLFHYANSNGLFPDDYAHILESLEETNPSQTGQTQNEEGPVAGHDPVMDDEEVPVEQDIPEEGVTAHEYSEEEEEPGSAFVQWLARREKPRALGEVKGKRKAKKEKEARKKPDQKESGQKGNKPNEPVVDLEAGSAPVKPKKGNRKKDQGIQLSPDVISETLAEVLASQGHIHAAIEMYEKLGLIYPEKKSFFAVKIENLKNT